MIVYDPSRGTSRPGSISTDSSGRGGRVRPSGPSSPSAPAPRQSVTYANVCPSQAKSTGQDVPLRLVSLIAVT